MLSAFATSGADYMSNTLDPHLPRGLDAEVFTPEALRAAASESTAPHTREHVTPFIYQNPDRFSVVGFRARSDDHSDLRWTLDTPEDWALISRMAEVLPVPLQDARLDDFLSLYEEYPELRNINASIRQKPLEA